jgi:hypothetical protein
MQRLCSRRAKLKVDIGRATLGRNFDDTIGRTACEACSAKWNLGTNFAFALGRRKTTKILDRVGRGMILTNIVLTNSVRTSQEGGM